MNQARSRAIDRLRFENRKKRSRGCDRQLLAEGAADPHDVLELREQGELLRAALAALTPDERQAIETTFFAGLTHPKPRRGWVGRSAPSRRAFVQDCTSCGTR
jgi:DNA-directed RNA polymerase specialized sigma24 family protein